MKSLTKPCNDCPFRKNSLAGWLADYTPEELHRIVMSENPFPCHLTHEEEIPWAKTKDYPICAGSLLYMKRNAKQPRNKELQKLINNIDKSELDNILFQTEFINHHNNG